jgi:hypothetical protein
MRRLLPVLICVVTACGDSETEAAPEMSPAAVLAARHACVAEELARTAQEDLETIQAGFASGVAPEGLTTFARAYLQHAQLRLVAYAQTDSALNQSRTPQDSARHERAASQMEIVPPAAGTLEANVITSYEQKARAMLADADHPCNWKYQLDE